MMDNKLKLPWRVRYQNNSAEKTPVSWIADSKDFIVMMTEKHDTVFIVKAVNSYQPLLEALEGVIADIESYEKVNNLSPAPGKRDCWQSVANARNALKLAKGE